VCNFDVPATGETGDGDAVLAVSVFAVFHTCRIGRFGWFFGGAIMKKVFRQVSLSLS